jgi:hypothetical protein
MTHSLEPTAPERRAPKWLKLMNLPNRALLRRGIGQEQQHLRSIPGRASGSLRSTPVAVLALRGERYLVAGFAGSDWVKNARRAGWAELSRGRRRERVLLSEVPVEERPPILRQFAREVRGGRSFLTFAADAPGEAVAKASPQHPVFLVRPGQTAATRP